MASWFALAIPARVDAGLTSGMHKREMELFRFY